MSGQSEEDVVEGGLAQRNILRLNIDGIEFTHDLGEGSRTAEGWNTEPEPLESGLFSRHRRQGPCRSLAVGLVDMDLDYIATEPIFEFIRRALGDQAALVDHSDTVGQLVGLVEVLSGEKDGGSTFNEVFDEIP